MEEFEKLLEESFVREPHLMGEKWFRDLEMDVREEITRWEKIMDSAGIA